MAQAIPYPGGPVRGSETGRPVMALFDLLGRAWSMGVVWQLQAGPCTFRELQIRCEGVSPSVLNQRLKELRATGLVDRGEDGFELTPLGLELMSYLDELGTWSKRWARMMPSPPSPC